MPVTDFQQKNDTPIVDLTLAALHSLANGSFATLAEYDNSDAGNLNFVADFELLFDGTAAPTAGNQCDLYLLVAPDGTNFTDTTGPPPNLIAGVFVMAAVDPNRLVLRDVPLPSSKFKAYFKNGAGVGTAASGSSLKMLARRQQGTS
ncbi:MAG: hypothetical protein ACREJC_03000 [Tepidisphaeraceae bacterium]